MMAVIGAETSQAVPFRTVEAMMEAQGYRAALSDETIDVWGLILDGSRGCLDQCGRWLCEEEWVKASRFVREEDRRRYLFAHGSLRFLLGRQLGIDPDTVAFQRGVTGKPALCERTHRQAGIAFNLSHAHGRALVALAKGSEVGVDLERVREEVDTVALSGRFYSPSEHKAVQEARDEDRAGTFFRYWVAKEAVLKAQGIGLSSIQQCEIVLAASSARSSVCAPIGSPIQLDWTIQHLSCGAEWEGAVVAKGTAWSLRVRE